MTSNWYLHGDFMGETTRPKGNPSFHVLCPKCGAIWASCVNQEPSHWTCVNRPCLACGRGSLAGADWMVHPYDPFRLPHALILRELDLAAEQGDRWSALW